MDPFLASLRSLEQLIEYITLSLSIDGLLLSNASLINCQHTIAFCRLLKCRWAEKKSWSKGSLTAAVFCWPILCRADSLQTNTLPSKIAAKARITWAHSDRLHFHLSNKGEWLLSYFNSISIAPILSLFYFPRGAGKSHGFFAAKHTPLRSVSPVSNTHLPHSSTDLIMIKSTSHLWEYKKAAAVINRS